MGYLLEITASTIVGGMLLLLILRMNASLLESATTLSFEKTVQSNITSLIEDMQYDFRRIGYKVSTKPVVTVADSNRISFLADIDNDDNIDTVSYYLGSVDQLMDTQNPRDRILYRAINNTPVSTSNLGVIDFKVWYFNQAGSFAASLNEIKLIKYALEVESIFPINDEYKGAYAERIINLR
jgi:hypothetical protein